MADYFSQLKEFLASGEGQWRFHDPNNESSTFDVDLADVPAKPEGWPEGSSVLKGTLESYRTLKLCPGFWNDDFTKRLEELSTGKSLYVIQSISELNGFVESNVGFKAYNK